MSDHLLILGSDISTDRAEITFVGLITCKNFGGRLGQVEKLTSIQVLFFSAEVVEIPRFQVLVMVFSKGVDRSKKDVF